jgi:hypothetical protein
MLTWGSNPGVLSSPSSSATLYATANDPERDSPTYHWSVVSAPGASPAIASPNAASTSVSGLTIGGTYVFNVDITDGANTVSRKVYLIVYASNQPPTLGATGFRLPAPYGYCLEPPHTDRTPIHTTVNLPLGTVTLSANIGDVERDSLSGLWTEVSRPAGATDSIGGTISIYASFRAQVFNITTPGDYEFEISIHDKRSGPVTTRCVLTVRSANTPPVIDSIVAASAVVTLPADSTRLVSYVRDAENDLLRFWWVVKAAPAGTKPQFARQGWHTTGVDGLTKPGNYVFTMRAFDDISMTTKDKTVRVVEGTGGVGDGLSTAPRGNVIEVFPNPCVAGEELHARVGDARVSQVRLIDILGRVVVAFALDGGLFTLPMNGIPPGIYFVSATEPNSEIVRTLSVVR